MSSQQQTSANNPASDETSARNITSQTNPTLLSIESFVMHLAKDLRAKGDPDLPLTFYAEQARQLLLTGKHPKELSASAEVAQAVNDQVYQSWAHGKG